VHAVCPLCLVDETFVLQRTRPLRPDDAIVRSTLAEAGQPIEFRACLLCGLIYRTPRPTPEHLAHYYQILLPPLEPGIMATMGVTRETAHARNEKRYAELYDTVRRVHDRPTGHIIDLGGWDGLSLVPWQRGGWQVTLIDPGNETRTMASPSIRAVGSAREALSLPNPKASIITSYHCIEHVLDIRAWLREARLLSERGTTWVIEVPFEVIYMRGLADRHSMQGPPPIHEQHLNFFTPRALRSLARMAGLRTLSTGIVVTPYWFGPTVSLRLYARDAGDLPADAAELRRFPSPKAARGYLSRRLLLWRRWSGLKYRAHRLLRAS
jgi:Methyltransferase domain